MQNAGNRLNIVILDACRNDPFSRALGVGGLAKVEPIGLFVSYATGAGAIASDGKEGENGIFTKYLIKYMQQPLDLQEVFQRTREDVYTASNQKQFPAIYNQTINGKFFFTIPKAGEQPIVGSIKYTPKKRDNSSFIKFIIDPKLKDDISAYSSSSKIKNDMLESIIDIENHTTQKLTIEYRVKYFDEDGIEVGNNMSIWQPLFLDAENITKIRDSSFVPMAKKCKVYLR
jgi:uncharacterized protein YcfL